MTTNDIKQIDSLLEKRLKNVATKDDLKSFVTKDDAKQFATKNDLKNFATKDDLKNFATKNDLKGFATKEDLKAYPTKDDLKNGLNALEDRLTKTIKKETDDVVAQILNVISPLEARVEKIEDRLGLSNP